LEKGMEKTMGQMKDDFKLKYCREQTVASGEIYVFDKVVDSQGRLYCYRILNSQDMKKKFPRKEYEQQGISLNHSVQANCF